MVTTRAAARRRGPRPASPSRPHPGCRGPPPAQPPAPAAAAAAAGRDPPGAPAEEAEAEPAVAGDRGRGHGGQEGAAPEMEVQQAVAVRKALLAAGKAAARAERGVERVGALRSARPRHPLLVLAQDQVLLRPWLRPALQLAGLAAFTGFAFAARFAPPPARVLAALAQAAAIVAYGRRREALSPSGGWAAVAVGWGTMLSDLRLGLTLVYFFVASSRLSAFKAAKKAELDGEFKPGEGRRDWKQ